MLKKPSRRQASFTIYIHGSSPPDCKLPAGWDLSFLIIMFRAPSTVPNTSQSDVYEKKKTYYVAGREVNMYRALLCGTPRSFDLKA